MWLSESGNGNGETENGARCPSPPLEGGESLCDFYAPFDRNNVADSLVGREYCDIYQGNDLQFNNLPYQMAPTEGPSGEGSHILSLLGPAQLMSANSFTQTFLQSILSSVESRDPVVASAWMETLLDVIDLLPKEILKRDILTLAVSKGQLSQPLTSRLLCCKILGKISTKFEPYVIRKEVVPLVQCLCQDTDYEVRGEMCRQLDAVARGIGLEATRSTILPELVELANDEEECVQLVSIETVVRMLPMLDDETCNQTIIPLVKKLCESSYRTRGLTLPGVAQHLGRFCHSLSKDLNFLHRRWFLKFFKKLSEFECKKENEISVPDVVPNAVANDFHVACRQACAFNFPAMVMFADPSCFMSELFLTYSALCSDNDPSVRRTIACSFHVVAGLLDQSSQDATEGKPNDLGCQPLLSILNILMKDPKIEVLEGLLPHLTKSLELVTKRIRNNDGCEAQLAELIHSLVVFEVTTAHASNWRLHADLLTCFSCLPKCLTSDKVQPSFLPLLLHKMHSARPIPCRLSAAYSLLVFLRYTPHSGNRQEIIHTLVQEFCLNKSCHKRMLFLHLCDLVMDLFSKGFFKSHFYKPLLSLSSDRVANIRLRLCSCLPHLKSLLLLPQDSQLLQKLESCVKKLMIEEKDKDVSLAIAKTIEELDKIEVALDPATARRSSCNLDVVVDLEDLRKEADERKLWNSASCLPKGNSKKTDLSVPSSPIVLRKGKIPTRNSSHPFSTHSWERPHRRSLIEVTPSTKSSTLPRRRNLSGDKDTNKTVSLPSSPRESRKITSSRIPRVSGSPMGSQTSLNSSLIQSPKINHPVKISPTQPTPPFVQMRTNTSRIPTPRNSFRRNSLLEDT